MRHCGPAGAETAPRPVCRAEPATRARRRRPPAAGRALASWSLDASCLPALLSGRPSARACVPPATRKLETREAAAPRVLCHPRKPGCSAAGPAEMDVWLAGRPPSSAPQFTVPQRMPRRVLAHRSARCSLVRRRAPRARCPSPVAHHPSPVAHHPLPVARRPRRSARCGAHCRHRPTLPLNAATARRQPRASPAYARGARSRPKGGHWMRQAARRRVVTTEAKERAAIDGMTRGSSGRAGQHRREAGPIAHSRVVPSQTTESRVSLDPGPFSRSPSSTFGPPVLCPQSSCSPSLLPSCSRL